MVFLGGELVYDVGPLGAAVRGIAEGMARFERVQAGLGDG